MFKVELSYPSLTNDLWNDLQPSSKAFAFLRGLVKGLFDLGSIFFVVLGRFGNGELKIIVKIGNYAF